MCAPLHYRHLFSTGFLLAIPTSSPTSCPLTRQQLQQPWRPLAHISFGPAVNVLFAALVLGLGRMPARAAMDPAVVEEALQGWRRGDVVGH